MSKSSWDAWMPIWIGDYIADTQGLTTEEHGAYFLLLIHLWKQNNSQIFDERSLHQITKLSRYKWPKVWKNLQGYFRVEDGVLSHDRVGKELEIAREKWEANQARTEAATAARMARNDKRNGKTSRSRNEDPFTITSKIKNKRGGEGNRNEDEETITEFPYRGAYRAWLRTGGWPSPEIQDNYAFDYVPPPDHPDHPGREDWRQIRQEESAKLAADN